LADFIVDWTGSSEPHQLRTETIWTIHCDGVWCHAGIGAAAVITSPTCFKYRYVTRLHFALESDKCMNNIAEYEAIILGLHKLQGLGVTTCIVKFDYKIVVGQIEKDYSKEPVLMQYLSVVQSLEKQFKGFTLQHIERNKNEEADMLAKAAATGDPLPYDVFFHTIGTPDVRNPEGLQITQDPDDRIIVHLIMTKEWRAPITLYLQGHYHPSNQSEAKRLKHISRDFTVIDGQLYKKGISQLMLKCTTSVEGIELLCEVHRGTCETHLGPRALATKVMRQGFYWPTIVCVANRVVRSCEVCQKFSPPTSAPLNLQSSSPTPSHCSVGASISSDHWPSCKATSNLLLSQSNTSLSGSKPGLC
jgi:ribonuclease HI